MTRHVALMWVLLTLLLAGAARAEMVTNLNSATVPVADQGAKALSSASRQALAEVLVKISGSGGVLRNPEIKEALSQARSQVQQYAYARGRPPANELLVEIEFDRTYVTDLVRRAGAPLWTANRPLVLTWIVMDGEEGRAFVNPDTTPDEALLLADEFSRRGVPLELPVFDLADMGALSVDAAWRMNASAILSASSRYEVQDVLAGRISKTSDGKLTGDWSYFHSGNRVNRSATAPDLQAFMRNGVDIVAGSMAARYAMRPSTGGDGVMRMAVSGVESYTDYAAIVSFLENLELVEAANIELIRGGRLELRLQTAVDASQLATLIELNDRLSPMPGTGLGPQLNYQWLN